MENKTNQTAKITLVSVATILFAVFLVSILLKYTKVSLPELFTEAKSLPLWLWVSVTAIMLFNIMLGAQNWRLTVERVPSPNRQNYLFYLTYSAISAMSGLIIPLQFSNLIVRSLSLKFLGNASAQKSAVTALVSQSHDITVATAFLIPGIAVLFGNLNIRQWLICETALIAASYILFSHYAYFIVKKICTLKIKNETLQKLLNMLEEGLNAGMFDNALMANLYRNSLLKFCILALRAYLVSYAIELTASPIEIVSIFSILQLSIIFTVTPGNLGVNEWGWVGLLTYLGVSTYGAGQFALITRIFGYFSTSLVFVGTLIIFTIQKSKKE